MRSIAQSTTSGQTGGTIGAAVALLTGLLSCFATIDDHADAAIMLTLGLLLLASGAVGLASGYWLAPIRAVPSWQHTLANGRWVAGGVVIACAFGAAFDPFLTVILLVAGVLLVGAVARCDRGPCQSLLPGVGLLIAGLLASAAVLGLAYHG